LIKRKGQSEKDNQKKKECEKNKIKEAFKLELRKLNQEKAKEEEKNRRSEEKIANLELLLHNQLEEVKRLKIENEKKIIEKGKTTDAIAFGYYEDTHLTKGWGVLKIETVDKFKPEQQAFAAGFLEGFLTKHLIHDFWDNYRLNEYGNYGPPKKLSNFLAKQYLWLHGIFIPI